MVKTWEKGYPRGGGRLQNTTLRTTDLSAVTGFQFGKIALTNVANVC